MSGVCFCFLNKSKHLLTLILTLPCWLTRKCVQSSLTTRCRAIFTHTRMWMVLQKEAYVSLCCEQICHHRNEYRGKNVDSRHSNTFLCFCLRVYWTKQCIADIFLLVFPPAGCGLWKVRMLDARCLTWCLVTSWGLVGCHVPFSAPASNSSPSFLYPSTSRGGGGRKKSHPSVYQWCWTHPLTRGGHWLTADASPMLPSFWVTETKDGDWVDAGVGSTFHFSLFYLVNEIWGESVYGMSPSMVLPPQGGEFCSKLWGIWSMYEQGVQRKSTFLSHHCTIIFTSSHVSYSEL